MPSIFPAVEAGSIAELAAKLELDPAAVEKTVAEFNAAVQPGTFDHTVLDDCRDRRSSPFRKAIGRARSTSRLITAIRCGPALLSLILVCA